MDKKFITPERVGEIAQMTKGMLAQRRFQGLPPKFYKPSPKTVLYDEAEVIEWLEGSVRTQTGDAA